MKEMSRTVDPEQSRPEPGAPVVITVTGDLDVTSVSQLRDAVHDRFRAGTFRIVLDLGPMTFVDSPGLGMMVGLLRAARANGGDVRLANVPARIARLLTITGLDDVFALDEDLEAAARSLGDLPAPTPPA